LSLLFVPGKTPLPPSSGKKGGGKGRKRSEPEEIELTPEDADTLTYDGETVVLDSVVRDELILATPIFPLCSEDCAGISRPPEDEAKGTKPDDSVTREPDVDPRLLPLLRLKTKRE
jgi:uncharacterized protein